jgi:hypothetical protein
MDASRVQSKAAKLAEVSHDPHVKELAMLVRDLASECQRIEKKADDAQHDADRAKRAARG